MQTQSNKRNESPYAPRMRRQALGKTEALLEEEARRAYRDGRTPRRQEAMVSQKKKKHPVLWGIVALICLILLVSLALFLAPQLLGVRYQTLPNLAFTGEGMIAMNEETLSSYRAQRDAVMSTAFYDGIVVDGISLGGMSMQEAREALAATEAAGGGGFSVMVRVGDRNYMVDDTMVPLERNVEEVLQRAYSLGRENTIVSQTGMTPMMERWNAIQNLADTGMTLETTLSYAPETIREITDQIADVTYQAPVSSQVASFDMNSLVFSFTEDQSGRQIDRERLYTDVMEAIRRGENPGMIEVDVEEILAPVTKAELMNSFGKISSYTTTTTSNANRNTNIQLSAEAINGTMVGSGETFSFNRTTGQRTVEKGYKEATAISGGQNVPEVGGGVCQTSSTLFNAVARADLEIVTRSPHAWPSSYVAKGMDATVNWPGLDFQFRNQTDWPIYIVASYRNRKITVDIYGHLLGDGISIDLESTVVQTIPAPSGVKEVLNESLPHGTRKTTVKARKGYVVETYKVYSQAGKEVRREKLCTSTYKAYQETVEYN